MRVFPFALLALAWIGPATGATSCPDDSPLDPDDPKTAEDLERRSLLCYGGTEDSNGDSALTALPASETDAQKMSLGHGLSIADADAQKLIVGYTMSSSEVDKTQLAKIGYALDEKPWITTDRSKTSFTFKVDAARKEVGTTESRTLTRSVDLIPFKFSYWPTDSLKLSFSAGAGFLFTDKLDRLTSVEVKKRDLAFVYTVGASYQMAVKCLSLGVDYTIRTDELTSGKRSYDWMPVLTINFLEPCTTKQ